MVLWKSENQTSGACWGIHRNHGRNFENIAVISIDSLPRHSVKVFIRHRGRHNDLEWIAERSLVITVQDIKSKALHGRRVRSVNTSSKNFRRLP